jgi:hypothetical protein
MKIKRPYSIAIPVLLVLGLLSLWIASSMDIRPLSKFSTSCEELETQFEEELEEEAQEDLLSFSVLCPFILDADNMGVLHFCRSLGASAKASTTGQPSGWMMPLRI